MILDEGPPEPTVGHTKYPVAYSNAKFLEAAKTAPVAAGQLTLPKLERLMDRYAGKEWLPGKLKHLDDPASEKTDVLRGLRTYAAAGPEYAKTFAGLYAKLPKERQVLEASVVKELGGR